MPFGEMVLFADIHQPAISINNNTTRIPSMGTIRHLDEALILPVILLFVLAFISATVAADDPYEENDDLAHAFPLEPGVYTGLNASDPDCFGVNISASGLLRITVWYDGSLGSAELHLFDGNGSVMDSSVSASGEEQVEREVMAGERYVFEVRNGSDLEYHMAIVNGNEHSWIFSVYMDGDNSLHDNMEPDLSEMREGGSGNGLHIPVLRDGEGSKDTVVLYIMPEYDIELPAYVVNQSWGKEVNMGDPMTLANWLEWCIRTFDTGGRTALDLWDHGKGVWGLCWDSNSGNDLLTLADIRTVIETSGVGGIELLGSDSCLMQVVELAYEVDGLATYFIASQEDEPKDGWDYAPFLIELSGNLSWTGEQLGRSIIRGYIAEYGQDGDETLSVINIEKVGGLTDSLSALAREFRGDMDMWADEIRIARDDTRDFNYYYVDLLNLVQNLLRRTDNGTLLGLLDDLESRTREVVLNEEHGAKRFDSNGLSLYFPKSGYDSDYDDITFGVDSGWGEFLKEWIPTMGGPMDHFDRTLVYPLDNDSYEGNDTMLVKVIPFTDRTEEDVVILVELVNASGSVMALESLNATIREDTSGFIDIHVQLGGEHPAAWYSVHYSVRVSLYDSEGNRDDVITSEEFKLFPFDTTPPPPPQPVVGISSDGGTPLLAHQGQEYHFTVEIYAGVPSSFHWDLDGDTIIDLVTSLPSCDHTFSQPGDIALSVSALDDWNQTGNDSIPVHVNAIPVFHANETSILRNPGIVDIQVTVEDPDGEIVWYEWSIDGVPVWSGAEESSRPAGFLIEGPGNHTVQLTVTDSDGGKAFRNMTVRINAHPSISAITSVSAQNATVVKLMDRVEYILSVQARDEDGVIMEYWWDLDGDGTFETASPTHSFTVDLPPGYRNIGAKVVDDLGLTIENFTWITVFQEPEIFILHENRTYVHVDGIAIHYETDALVLIVSIQAFIQPTVNEIDIVISLDGTTLHETSITFNGTIDEEVVVTVDRKIGDRVLSVQVSGGSINVHRDVTVTFKDPGERGSSDDDPIPTWGYYLLASAFVVVCGAMVVVAHTTFRGKDH